MRPRHDAADDAAISNIIGPSSQGFNEAAAGRRGGPAARARKSASSVGFNEAAAGRRGGLMICAFCVGIKVLQGGRGMTPRMTPCAASIISRSFECFNEAAAGRRGGHPSAPTPPNPLESFNEAAAGRRGGPQPELYVLDAQNRFNEAAAGRRGGPLRPSASARPAPQRFNEAAAGRRGGRSTTTTEAAQCLASMRPRHDAADDRRQVSYPHYTPPRFNEAAAGRRGGRGLVGGCNGRLIGFNEAAAGRRGGPSAMANGKHSPTA